MGKFKDLTGQKFGKLTVVSCAGKNLKDKRYYWWCVCDCTPDKEILVNGKYLCNGDTQSCGCLKKEVLIKRNTTHGMAKTRFYSEWQAMLTRCLNPNASNYVYYGGRGIKVCSEWLDSFENFRDDMYRSYLQHVEDFGEKDTTLDRIDVDGNYELSNCRWATWEEQMRNMRCIKLTHNGETHTVRQWSEILNINLATMWDRILAGKPIEDILYQGSLKYRDAKTWHGMKKEDYEKQSNK